MLRKTSEEPAVLVDTGDPSISAQEIVRALLRHKALIATSVISFMMLGALFWLLVPASYTATCIILVPPRTSPGSSSAEPGAAASTPADIQDQIEVLRSDKIASATIAKLRLLSNPELSGKAYPQVQSFIQPLVTGLLETLKLPPSTHGDAKADTRDLVVRRRFKDRLSALRVPNSNVIQVGFTTHDPKMSAEVANGVVDEFVRYWLVPPVTSASIPDNLVRDRVILSPAAPPLNRDQPGGATIMAAALMLGLLSGAAGVLVLEYADRSFRLPQQAEAWTQASCLGLLPMLPVQRASRERDPKHVAAVLVSGKGLTGLRCPGASQFLANLRKIELTVDLHRRRAAVSTFGVTSAVPSEGKTTSVINLARVLARTASVLVVDCDTSNPELSRVWAAMNGNEPPEAIFDPRPVSLPGGERFDFLTITSFLLSNQKAEFGRFKAVLENFDIVLLDMPPLSSAAALSAAANLADGLILIIKWGRTAQSIVSKSLGAAEHVRSKLLGSVLNQVDLPRLGRWDPDAGLLYSQPDRYRS